MDRFLFRNAIARVDRWTLYSLDSLRGVEGEYVAEDADRRSIRNGNEERGRKNGTDLNGEKEMLACVP